MSNKTDNCIDYAYLVLVNAANNNNKFYEIVLNPDYSIDVYYGRIGASTVHKCYGSHEKDFYTLKHSKEIKGYSDVSALHSTIDTGKERIAEELSHKDIDNESVNEAVTLLIKSSRDFVKKNYTIKAQDITLKMVVVAQCDIDNLAVAMKISDDAYAIAEFNRWLETLFTDIPRRMKDVNCFLAKSREDFEKIYDREQEMLDNIKGQIISLPTKNIAPKDMTVLEANGLQMRPVTYKEEDEIIAHLGNDYNGKSCERRYVKAFKVENQATRESYEKFKAEHNISRKDVKLFYHGSKVENWYSIMKSGLSLNPNAIVTGKMFGNGIYFASECRKSLNYMDVAGSRWNDGRRKSGFTAIYAVALGKCYEPSSPLYGGFTAKDLPDGCTSVYASKRNQGLGLANDEYVVYDQAQCTIKYLVEFTEPNVPELNFSIQRKAVRGKLVSGLDELTVTDSGVRTELCLENLPDSCQAALANKFVDLSCKTIYANIINDELSFTCENFNGKITEMQTSFTDDDKKFLLREIKKSYVASEEEWKQKIESLDKGKNISLDKQVEITL